MGRFLALIPRPAEERQIHSNKKSRETLEKEMRALKEELDRFRKG